MMNKDIHPEQSVIFNENFQWKKHGHVHVDYDASLNSVLLGGITISDGVTLTVNSDLNGASPQFTLTCISTGGPATTITWTRDSEMLTGSTVLNDTETAQYTHTLTVTGRLGGLYTCAVSNDKPSSVSSTYTVEGTCMFHVMTVPIQDACTCDDYLFPVASAPTSVMAVQEGPTSIRVSWSPPTPLGDTTGYRIYYSGGSSGSEDVSGVFTDNYLLTGLQNGDSYTISIVATSQHFFSESIVAVDMEVGLGEDCVM